MKVIKTDIKLYFQSGLLVPTMSSLKEIGFKVSEQKRFLLLFFSIHNHYMNLQYNIQCTKGKRELRTHSKLEKLPIHTHNYSASPHTNS